MATTRASESRRALPFTAAAAAAALVLLLLPPFIITAAVAGSTGRGSSCTRSCGNVSIPYPFGVEAGCYQAAGFNLTCKQHSHHHHQPPKLFLGDGTVQVLDISVEHSTVRINSPGVQLQYDGASGSQRPDPTSCRSQLVWSRR